MTVKPRFSTALIEQLPGQKRCSNARENTFYLSCCHQCNDNSALRVTDALFLLSFICHCCHYPHPPALLRPSKAAPTRHWNARRHTPRTALQARGQLIGHTAAAQGHDAVAHGLVDGADLRRLVGADFGDWGFSSTGQQQQGEQVAHGNLQPHDSACSPRRHAVG